MRLAILVFLLSAGGAHAQVATPENHPGYALAQAIAAQGCVLHQDDVAALLDGAGLQPRDFPQMALPLIQDGILAPTGNGTLTLVAWGLCVGDPQPTVQEGDSDGADTAQPAIAAE